jgi:hypothetical protein
LGLGNFRERGGIEFTFDRLSEDDQLRELNWIDTNYPTAFTGWKLFKHPQLGAVEIGGIDTKITRRNPPPGKFLVKETEKILPFALHHAALLPLIQITETNVMKVSEGVYKVVANIVNKGWLPTNITQISKRIKRSNPVIVEINLDEDTELVTGLQRVDIGQLDGRSAKLILPREVGGEIIDKTRASVEWVVKTTGKTDVELVARCPKAGTHRIILKLE